MSVDPALVLETNGVANDLLATSKEWRNSLCVFCGSLDGNDPDFMLAAKQVGEALSRSKLPLVYGGGTSGLMRAVAEATYSSGGRVLGVTPKALLSHERPTNLDGVSRISEQLKKPTLVDNAKEEDRSVLIVVDTMHERKQEMAHYAELGFVALPGGYGTFEEILEMTTWTQLGIHTKPVVLLSINNFYSPLRTFVKQATDSGFIKKEKESFLIFIDPPSLFTAGVEGESSKFDWGEAALEAVKEWHSKQAGVRLVTWETMRAK